MTRREVMTEVLAVLEAERFAPVVHRPPPELAPITPEQAERNQQLLAAALSDDAVVVAWAERGVA